MRQAELMRVRTRNRRMLVLWTPMLALWAAVPAVLWCPPGWERACSAALARCAMTPHEALRLLLGREREHFDPAVLGALVQTVGLYPAGTVFLTDTGRMMLSIAPNSADPRRPICRELSGVVNAEITHTPEAPLTPNEKVMSVIPPEQLDVDIEDLLTV